MIWPVELYYDRRHMYVYSAVTSLVPVLGLRIIEKHYRKGEVRRGGLLRPRRGENWYN